MKTLFATMTAVAALATLPALAHAQPIAPDGVNADAVVTPHGNWTLKEREDWLYSRLDAAHDDGSIGPDEADRVHHEIGSIRHDESDMRDAHGGQLTDNETAALEARLDGVADQIHWLHDNGFRRPW